MTGFRRAARRLFERLVGLEETPAELATACAVGVFVGMFPLVGVHTIICFAVVFFSRLNLPAMFIGTWIHNPFNTPLILIAEYEVGRVLLRWERVDFGEFQFNFRAIGQLGREILAPLLAGWIVLGIALALLTQPLLRRVIERARRKSAPAVP
ncbi:DUF2062 domain-containing protein [bacterium]|nr:DUF2062 domain-containing protein [bacterium]